MPPSVLVAKKEPGTETPARRPFLLGRSLHITIAALVLFAVINVGLWLRYGQDRVSKNMWNGTGSIDLAVDRYAQLSTRPKVVLLGSSLMMYPFWAMDKEADPKVPDIFHQRQSVVLENALAKPGQPKPVVYSFAIFGQMVSDAYLYVDQFLKGDKAPQYLVLGIAPRDFHDSDLPAPMSTFSFKRLVNLSNFFDYAYLYLPEFQDRADFVFGKVCFFYGKRWYMQKETSRAFQKLATWLGIKGGATQPKPTTQAGFMMFGREDVRWKGSREEYARRYKNIDESRDVALQMDFLRRLLADCRQRQIKAIVVEMPLTDVNRSLLPQGFLSKFSAQVAGTCQDNGAQFLDLCAAPEFEHGDFWDTSHLNHAGGHKLIKRLLPLIN